MRVKEAITSALHLLVILFCFGLSIFSLALPFRPDLRLVGATWLQEAPQQLYWIGGYFALAGLFFLSSFYLLGRGKVLRISMGTPGITYDRKILKCIVNEFFANHFPQTALKAEVAFLPKEELEFSMEFPPLKEEEQKELLESIEQKLTVLLRDRFGYEKPFTLALKRR